MLGRRNRKKEVVRIDVDWLLGETTKKSTRDFSWFKRSIVYLTFVSAVVWSWPYASKAWLKWEWQQQLAQLSGKPSDDVLPIMLALKELNPSQIGASPTSPSNETPLMAEPPSFVARSLSDSEVQVPQIARAIPTRTATRMRINDSGSDSADSLDPPSTRQLQNAAPIVVSKLNDIPTIPTSMRTPRDQATTTGVPQLPNLSLTIPRTVNQAIVVPAPFVSPEPIDDLTSNADKVTIQTPESNGPRGYEKLHLEKLLPLLTSSQTTTVQHAFNELVRRGMTPPQLEIAVGLAQGDVEQRLKAMETIARDPKFEDSITWLVWMAESADPNVRRRAIVLLGSMTHPDAMIKLRILKSREQDSAIADQITQVLLASGTASNRVQ